MRYKSMHLYAHPHNFPFWIQRNKHDADSLPYLHVHDFVELVYVVEGRGKHLFQGEAYDIKEGDVFVINPGEAHSYMLEHDEKIEIMNCLFEPDCVPTAFLQSMQMSGKMDFFYVQPFLDRDVRFHHKLNVRGSDAAAVLAILERMLNELTERRSGFQTLIQMKMIELVVLLSRFYEERQQFRPEKAVPGEVMVQRVKGYVERHYSEKLSLPLLTELFPIGVRQLNRYFNRYLECSVMEYVHAVRIRRAQTLLVDTSDTIAAICEAVGYEDPSFFTKLFTREMGCSPGKYRVDRAGKQTATTETNIDWTGLTMER